MMALGFKKTSPLRYFHQCEKTIMSIVCSLFNRAFIGQFEDSMAKFKVLGNRGRKKGAMLHLIRVPKETSVGQLKMND